MTRRDIMRLLAVAPVISPVNAAERTTFAEEPGDHVPGSPGERYNRIVTDMLTWIRENQAENLLEAAHAIARTVMRGGTCWYNWDCGHSTTFDMSPGRDGVPEILTVGFDPAKARDGDLFLASKRSEYPVLTEKDILVVGTPSPWSRDAHGGERIVTESAMSCIRPYSDIWIENNITVEGGVVRLPGMPAPIGPVSGILGIVTLWMMLGDAVRIMAREGFTVPVRGDEPPLERHDPGYISLYDPLLDEYFGAVMRGIGMIGAEMGSIREAAGMAVDTVLSGGKVYCYGRYYETIPVEARTRRSGLALLNDLSDRNGALVTSGKEFGGESGDLVIMGIYAPDDPVDLAHLDTLKNMGIKTVSIGPSTRNMQIPAGRTVPKETDMHLGGICDTYGLFAVPGFERRVCPVSGALLMQTFWVTCLEIAGEIIHRTGNTPAVYLNGAVEGGMDHLRRMNAILEVRGY